MPTQYPASNVARIPRWVGKVAASASQADQRPLSGGQRVDALPGPVFEVAR